MTQTTGIAERVLYRLAKRWIAGYTLDEAITYAKEANQKRMTVIVNRLGEHTPDRKLIGEYASEYLRILEKMHQEKIDGTISVKPSQLGLAADRSLFDENLGSILESAKTMDRFVWLDMENSPYTENTIDAYRRFFPSYRDMGICLQANMRRTRKDMEDLLRIGGKVRLVKGAYPESEEVAYKKKDEIDRNYHELLGLLFKSGNQFVLGTHDEKLIEEARRLSKESNADFQFHFLKGIRDELKTRLIGEGYRVGEYIPYGPEWYNYSKRRIRERKRNILLLLRSVTG